MKDKSEISYVIEASGDLSDINLLKTETVKVPEVGEIIHFNTYFDFDEIKMHHRELTEKQIKALLPSVEEKVRGNFVVTDVKRYVEVRYVEKDINWFSDGLSSFAIKTLLDNSTTGVNFKIPCQKVIETFEVFIKPVAD